MLGFACSVGGPILESKRETSFAMPCTELSSPLRDVDYSRTFSSELQCSPCFHSKIGSVICDLENHDRAPRSIEMVNNQSLILHIRIKLKVLLYIDRN